MRRTRASAGKRGIPRAGTPPGLTEGLDTVSGTDLRKGKYRSWKLIADAKLISYARAYCTEKKIRTEAELRHGPDRDTGLHFELRKRKLIGQVFERKNFETEVLDGKTFVIPINPSGRKKWNEMSDDEIVAYAKAYCKEKKITKISGLQTGPNKYTGLHTILTTKKLLDKVFERNKFEEVVFNGKTFRLPLDRRGYKNWASLSDSDVLDFTRAYLLHNQITKPKQLERAYLSLYIVLQRRELLQTVFSEIEKVQEDAALAVLASALESFGGKGK